MMGSVFLVWSWLFLFFCFGCNTAGSSVEEITSDTEVFENACDKVACWEPPDPLCADDAAVTVYAPGGYCEQGTCVYRTADVDCNPGRCADGMCEVTPCQGVVCNHPDASFCSSGGGVVMYAADGFCADGDCYYASREVVCDGSCKDGVCGQYTCHGVYCDKSEARYCKDDYTLEIFAPRGVCSSATGEAVCAYADKEIICENGCKDGGCIENTCKGVACTVPDARYCQGDDLVVFDYRGRCVDGGCKYESHLEKCEYGCEGGECRENPCIGVTCRNPFAAYCEDETVLHYFLPEGVCDEGVCVYEGETLACAHGCEDGACVDDPCAGVTCNQPPASYCADDAVLTFWNGEPGKCVEGFCEYETSSVTCGDACEDGRCSDDFCVGVVCDLPGADFCLDDETLQHFQSSAGTCTAGVCGYEAKSVTCEGGCANGACQPYLEPLECVEDTCRGHGACDASSGKVVCECDPGWQGNRCETDIDECGGDFDDCDENAECINTDGSYECTCNKGYEGSGTVCEPTAQPCAPNPCLNGGRCMEADAGVECDCPPGFGGDFCEADGHCIDDDGDGFGENCEEGEDCDDRDAALQIWVSAYVDSDLDGIGGSTLEEICAGGELPLGYETTGTDCNDENSEVFQILTGYKDEDGDGFGAESLLSMCGGDALAPAFTGQKGDCNDDASTVHPGAPEVGCNGVDDDCDAATPDSMDQDGDGYTSCVDCDDDASAVHPNAEEVLCNGLNDDCDTATPDSVDADGDGHTNCEDCNDGASAVHPGATEINCNGVNDDCDTATPDSVDADGDGHTNCEDCNDGASAVHPGATEMNCNGVNDDCDTATPDSVDADGDGYTNCEDCNDGASAVNPGATEVRCNGADDDCNAATPDSVDADGDGHTNCEDCNDANAFVHPGLTEILCNGADDDCSDATIDAPDADGDSYSYCSDCDDQNASVNPGNPEILCNGLDDDCNDLTSDLPEIETDLYNCGGCGNNCRTVAGLWPQNSVPAHAADFDCLAGRCVIEECRAGFQNDPQNPYDDCDLDLSTIVASVDIGSGTYTLNIDEGDLAPLTAVCSSSLGNSWDCTAEVEWLNTDWIVADVSQFGVVSPLIPGHAEIWALIDGVSSAPVSIHVVRYTEWVNRDTPTGSGDYELVGDIAPCGTGVAPSAIECRTVDGVLWSETGEVVTCTPSDGLRCIAASQPDGAVCSDYRVRFICP